MPEVFPLTPFQQLQLYIVENEKNVTNLGYLKYLSIYWDMYFDQYFTKLVYTKYFYETITLMPLSQPY